MAKKSVRNRNKNRVELVTKNRAKRDEWRTASVNMNLTDEEREAARTKLHSMKRDCSASRRRNRCKMCGRPRAYNRLTGLCRLHMRLAIIGGMVPGMRKASW